uniref:Core Histone H2A/H2B/H3 domain-containing protein n=1 Tax=Anopheles culicifacies TaxID=139723 RepID=A0A182M0S9_9DIPT
MGAESDSSISNIENDSYRSNTIQSRPNFSFLPSHQHSSPNKNHSPKRTNAAAPHRLASMPTVPNTDHEENDSTSAASTPRKSSRKPSPTKSKTKNRQQAQSSNDRQAHTRKQRAPGQLKVLKEIINLQGTVHNLIPKLSFSRVIREVLSEYSTRSLRVTPQMLLCLQEATEIYLVQLFEDSYRSVSDLGESLFGVGVVRLLPVELLILRAVLFRLPPPSSRLLFAGGGGGYS